MPTLLYYLGISFIVSPLKRGDQGVCRYLVPSTCPNCTRQKAIVGLVVRQVRVAEENKTPKMR